MPDRQDADHDTFTRIMVALAVNDADPPPTRPEIDQLADELIEWGHQLRDEFRRAAIAERVGRLSRTEIEAQLALTACCTRLASMNEADSTALSDDDLREQLVEVEAFRERMAA
jgi:hypothetical protein